MGKVYAYLGLKEKAVAEGQKGVDLTPVAKNHLSWTTRVQDLSLIYLITEKHELAINEFEYLLSIPGYTTKWGLRLYPLFDPLRENPRFQKLIAED